LVSKSGVLGAMWVPSRCARTQCSRHIRRTAENATSPSTLTSLRLLSEWSHPGQVLERSVPYPTSNLANDTLVVRQGCNDRSAAHPCGSNAVVHLVTNESLHARSSRVLSRRSPPGLPRPKAPLNAHHAISPHCHCVWHHSVYSARCSLVRIVFACIKYTVNTSYFNGSVDSALVCRGCYDCLS
jgi:hypothetical protein